MNKLVSQYQIPRLLVLEKPVVSGVNGLADRCHMMIHESAAAEAKNMQA